MYLRPASRALTTASASGSSPRTLASLTRIGKLMPAITSTGASSMTEIARFDGVPPNMSVRMMTPSPVLVRLMASRICFRRTAMSSSGPIEMVSS
jgi:hypothetical protein